MNIPIKNKLFWQLFIVLFIMLIVSYSNHFNNGFEFDDSHSIVNNTYIRDIKNIPLFYTGIQYQGTNPGNQDYRPVVATFHAIDYWLGNGYNQIYFHIDIFFSYLLLLVLLFIMIRKILDLSLPSANNKIFALMITGFYGLHTANAETVNYICMRSDSFSTLCIVASFLLYMHPITKKYFLYLITVAIGLGAKENTAMFGVLLFLYILFFEDNVSLVELVSFKKNFKVLNALKKSLPALIFSFGLFFISRKAFFPASSSGDGGHTLMSTFIYFYTQWVVIIHYLGNYILPLDLSVDPDFSMLPSVIDQKVLLSLAVILVLFAVIVIASVKRESRPVSFGLLWFFVTLAPTSTIFVFTQIANDHRTFLPFVGLTIGAGWGIRLLYLKYEEPINNIRHLKPALIITCLVIIGLYAYGTYQRNEVWGSSETLWHDAAEKGPNNGRAQLNYGLSLMAKGEYDETLKYFNRCLELMPYWAYIHINMGILREAMGFHEEAETYFKNAIRYQPYVPDGYYFYSRWLHGKERVDEAIEQLKKAQEMSPAHARINEYLQMLQSQKNQTPEDKLKKLEKNAEENKTHGNYIELSLEYYRNGRFNECIIACEKAIAINPQSAIAYNNMCSAYNAMQQWEKGVESCTKAVEMDPQFQLAKNNLAWAKQNLKK